MKAMMGFGPSLLSIVLVCLMIAPAGITSFEASAVPSRSTTIMEGTLTGQVTWAASGSPYVIEGNITISPTGILTVDKGVTLQIAKGIHIMVQGKLAVKGTDFEPVVVTGMGVGAFDGINFTSGSYGRFEKLNLSGGKYGIDVAGMGATVHLLNSTVTATGAGISSKDGAVVWTVNSTIKGSPRIRIQTGTVYECWWLFFSVVMDNGNPWKLGADLKATVNREFDSRDAYNAFDNIDPQTDSNGRIRPVPIEEYFHDGMLDNFQNKLYLRMTAVDPERSWTKNSQNINISENIHYTWTLDVTPPPTPLNFSLAESGGTYLVLGWEWDHNPNDHQLARFEIRYALTGETEYQTDTINNKNLREWNLSGLVTEKDYVVFIQALDVYGNSAKSTPIDASTRDVAKPFAPYNFSIQIENRLDAVVSWNPSASPDVIGYQVFVNDTAGGKAFAGFAEGKTARKYTVTNLTSETEYQFWVRAVDDGIPPNYSPFGDAISATTGDITSPAKPLLELYLISPSQYIPGSPYYNRTYVGFRGTVAGENRTFIDIYINGIKNEFTEAERPKTLNGKFMVYLFLEEGEHRVQAMSIDPTGNEGPLSDELKVIVDRTLPKMVFPRHAIEVDANDEFELRVNTSDENGVANVTWTIIGGMTEIILKGGIVKTKLPAGTFEARCEVVDVAGNRNFSVVSVKCWVPDHLAPTPKSTDPVTGATDVHVDAKIVVVFSEALRWDILKGTLAKASAPNVPLASVMVKDTPNLTVTVTPAELEPVTDYIFTLSRIMDVRGNNGENVTIAFKTLDPMLFDSDGDGIPNYYEVQRSSFLSPSNPDDAIQDHDGDGLTNLEEYQAGTDPEVKDTDEDGMDDGWEKAYGLNPKDKSDALKDADNDGFSNLEEFNDKSIPTDPKSHRVVEEESSVGLVIAIFAVIIVAAAIATAALIFLRRRSRQTTDTHGETSGLPSTEGSQMLGSIEDRSLPPAAIGGESCPACGASITDDLDYCPECGATLERSGALDPALDMTEDVGPNSGNLPPLDEEGLGAPEGGDGAPSEEMG